MTLLIQHAPAFFNSGSMYKENQSQLHIHVHGLLDKGTEVFIKHYSRDATIIMADFSLAVSTLTPTAIFNSPSNFLVIRYPQCDIYITN